MTHTFSTRSPANLHGFGWLRYIVHRLHKPATIRQGKDRPCAIGTFGHQGDIFCRPGMRVFGANPPSRRDAILKYLNGDHAVASIDATGFAPMHMQMIISMLT